MIRKKIAAVLVAVAVSGSLAACSSSAGSGGGNTDRGGTTKVSMGVFTGTFLSIVPWVADAQGFFKKNGLDVNLSAIDSGPQMTALLASHELDFVLNSIDNLAQARKQGLKPVVVAGNVDSSPFVVIVRKGLPIQTDQYPAVMQSLKGKKFGVQARGGSTELIVRDMLSDAGMNPDKDVVWIGIGGPAKALPALQNGSIDAYIAFDPTQTVAEAQGFAKPIVDMTKGQGPSDFQHVDYNGAWSLDSYISAHQDTVKRFLKSELQATCWIHDPANLDKLVDLLKSKISSSGLTADQYKAMIQRDAAIVGATFQRSSLDHWNSFLMHYKLVSTPMSASDVLWSQLPQKNPYC